MLLFELQDRPKLDKEFDRNIMPQIRKNNLQDSGFKFEKKKIKLSKLKPVQSQRVKGMHSQALKGFQDGSIHPIIIDKNNYIVNGHHRYDVARSLDMDKVKVLKVNATVEELIDFYKHTSSDEPTIEEQLKAKLQQKLNEIKLEPDLYKDSDPKDNSYITDTYQDATSNWSRIGSLPGITNSEMYNNGHTISIFLVENKQPVFLLNIQRLADGYSTINVVAHSQHRGKALSIPLYLAVSKRFGKPLYSFGSQSVAGNRIWEKLYQQYPNRVKAVNVKTNQELDVESVLNDNNFETRLKLLPESVQEGDVIQGNFPNNKTPKDNIVVHVFISPAPGVQPDWIPSKPGVIKDQYQLSKEIEDVLAKGVKPEHIKVQINGTYIRMPEYGITENFKDGKVKGKSRPGRVKRAGASCIGSVTSLRKKAKNSSGEKAKMYHWCANMKSGRKNS